MTTTSEGLLAIRSRILVLALTCLALAASACAAPLLSSVGRGTYAMGTVLELELVAHDRERADRALDAAIEEVRALESQVSRFEPESEISRLGRGAGRERIVVSHEVGELIDRALRYHDLTEGAFDVSVGPLIALWSRAGRTGAWPDPTTLGRTRELVGLSRVLRIDAGNGVGLRRAGMSLDFGGIAKGYALELVAASLRAAGFERGLLSFGQSSVWALGAPADAEAWRLLVDTPLGPSLLLLRDRALSVSSSLGQTTQIGEVAVSHVVDPRSGEPVRHRAQAIVIAEDAAIAEALSTALLVLEPVPGLALVARLEGVEAELTIADGKPPRRLRSAGFPAYLAAASAQ